MRASVLILLVPVGFATYGGYIYYRLLWLRLQSRQALQHVDEQLSRHHDTIPHLLLAMSDFVVHETWIIEHVIQARYRSISAATKEERMVASTQLSAALHHLFQISERLSDLHSDEEAAMIHLQVVMSEQKIAVAREYYNHIVQVYNDRIEQFPHSLCAQIAGFHREALFELPAMHGREFAGLEA
jgi:LemA protein